MTEQTEDSATDHPASEDSASQDSAAQEQQAPHSQPPGGAAEDSERQDSQPHDGKIADQVEFISAERLIFFTDAVVAIAMTLLAFGLTTNIKATADNAAALQTLGRDWREYLAFLISFVVIGRHWRTHHRQFRYLARLDARIVTLNTVWLLMIVITPFTTRLLSGVGGFAIVFSLYAVIQVMTIVTELLMSRHIRTGDLLRPGAPEPDPRDDDATALIFAAVFAISIPVAFYTESAFVLWVAAAPVSRLVRRIRELR